MSVDLRTRWDDEVVSVDPDDFFDRTLPDLFATHRELLETAAHLDLRPMTVVVGERRWTLARTGANAPTPGGVHVVAAEPGDEPAPVEVHLTPGQVVDLVTDQVTPIGLMTGGTLEQTRGRIGRLLDWWLVLRCVLDDTPIHTAGSVNLPDDLSRRFTIDDDPAELRAFLEAAGFLHLRGVFTEAEMERVSDEMDAAAPGYRPDDGESWWATVADGTRRVVRMQRFEERSSAAAALLEDPRFRAIGELMGEGHTVAWSDRNRIEALYKPIGVTHGISDVPWHKDCSLGRHSYECCMLTVGISVSGADETSGQLRVIAGSHRALVWPSLLDTTQLDLPDIALATETGDVTVHLSCTLHMAQPPTERERRVLYTGFGLPPRDAEAAAAASHRLAVAAREAAPLNTSQ